MKGIKNALILSVFVILTAVGLEIMSQGATGTEKQIFQLGKQLVKVTAVLVVPLSLYFVAKELT